jgi:hypothetical protein
MTRGARFPISSRNLAVGAVALLALPLVAATRAPANGPEQAKTATQIFADAKNAMITAKNFHVDGSLASSGQSITLNLSMSPTGGGGSIQEPGVVMEIVVANKTVYIKADEASWQKLTGSKATAELVANHWIKAPAANADFADFAQLTESQKFMGQLASGSTALTKVPGTYTWAHRPAVVLEDGEGDQLYVANSTPAYMLHIQARKGSGSSGSMTFSDFGDAPMPTTPTSAISLPG